jgi:cysteine desulfurase
VTATSTRVYLDWNATTPPLPEVIRAVAAAMSETWANPSSIHGDGRRARKVVEEARAKVAALVSRDPRDVLFTGSGTEANNIALRSAFPEGAGGVLLTSRLEHPSITRVAEALEREGRARVRWLRVTIDGLVDMEELERALAEEKDVRLLALQAVNQEHGVIQPLTRAIALATTRGVPVHVDAVQAAGRLPVDALLAGADTLALAAHKLRGPKGIGALVARPAKKLHPVLVGGAQERGLRPGTVDPALVHGFGVAAAHATTAPERYAPLAALRDEFEEGLATRGLDVVGKNATRAPHTSCFLVRLWVGAELVSAMDLEGVSVSSGSACSAGTIEPSPVLAATVGEPLASHGLRISMGPSTTREDLAFALRALDRVLLRT